MRSAFERAAMVGCLSLGLMACAPGASVPSSAPCVTPRASNAAQAASVPRGPTPVAAEPSVRLNLHPVPGTAPRLEVEISISGAPSGTALRLAQGENQNVRDLRISDARGPIALQAIDEPPGARVTLARAPSGAGPLRLTYWLPATSDVGAPSSAIVVGVDRFRALGESVVLLPEALLAQTLTLEVHIDGRQLLAPFSASGLGIGDRAREGRGRMLTHVGFIAGPLGTAVFNDGLAHDELAWLGYTAFDPRAAAAEMALIRSALREIWQDGSNEEFVTLMVSSHAQINGYSLLPRAGSLWLHLGPSEPWSAPLRVGITHELIRRWIGGELRVGPTEVGREAESFWFTDGVARYLAARTLQRLGLLSPDEARDFVVGLLSVQATTTYRDKSNLDVAAAAKRDPKARACLVARGALYAIRMASLLRAHSEGASGLEPVVLGLLKEVRQTRAAVDVAAWQAAMARALGSNADPLFEASVTQGAPVQLPKNALGPCFRASLGNYSPFTLGFDEAATNASATKTLVGLDATGPAAAAGVLATDRLEAISYRDGNSEAPVKLQLVRADKKLELEYLPRGSAARGQLFTRVPGVPNLACGDVF